MDDRLYQDALRRRADLQNELRELDRFISLAERLLRERSLGGTNEVESTSSHEEDAPAARRRNPTPPRQLAELAREEILATGRPMTRGELVTALEKRGVEMVAKDKAKNLGTILWRFPEMFINVPGVGYWPRDIDPPEKIV